jgi:hypothetical protein
VGAALGADLIRRIVDLRVVKANHGGAVLNLHEMLTLAAIGAQIIPTDGTPGAREAGMVDYIDTKIKGLESSRLAYQKGLQEVDNVSKGKFGAPFVELPGDQQKDVLKSIEKSDFFGQVWKDTVEAFSRSPLGQKVMGYPGAAQPHGYHDIAGAPMDTH